MAWLTNSNKEWVCCIQEPYITKFGVPRLPKGYGVFWSNQEFEEYDKIKAIIILPRRFEAYQISQYSSVNEIHVYVREINMIVVSMYCPMHLTVEKSMKNVGISRKENKNMIVCMDFNAYRYEWGATCKAMKNCRQKKRGAELYEMFDEYKLYICNEIPHIPTFVRKEGVSNTGMSHIDVTICTNEVNERIRGWKVQETVFLTDHNPIFFEYVVSNQKIKENKNEERKRTPWKRPSSKMKAIMCEELERNVKYINKVKNEKEIDRFIEIHKNEVIRVLKGVFNEKREGKEKVFWWTENVEQAHKKLKTARRRMRRYQHASLRDEFNKQRREFRSEVNRAKREAWKEFLKNIQSPWEGLIKILRTTDKGKIPARTLADLEGKYGKDIEQTLQMLGKQFYPTPAPFSNDQLQVERRVEVELSSIEEKGPRITVSELKYALSQVSMNSAPGADQITNNVMSILASKKYEGMYLNLFNRCVELSYFPNEWKNANVILIPKKGGQLDTVKAFRPISLTSVYAKLFERIILMRLHHYLKITGTLVENQHAYRKGKSTQTALFEMFELVQYAINKRGGGVCVVVFLDISGAFDRTWHAGILHRLLTYNIPKYLIGIIRSYLKNRTVKFNESGCEHTMDLTQGCPQGGVLSPVLWNILFNELLGMQMESGKKRTDKMKIIGYADDAALICKADTVKEASNMINKQLEKIYNWSVENRVVFNATKLAVLTISNRQTTVPPAEIYYNGILINEVTRYKYLGLIVDNKLNWKAQIDDVIKKLDKITRCLRNVKGMDWGIKMGNFRLLYRSIFFPVMTYGISIWGWKAAQRCVYERFNKEIRKFGMIATRCMRTTSNAYIRGLLNTQSFEEILTTEVLSISVRQFHITHTERQKVYESYTRSIKRIEYPQCIDHHFMMCRKKIRMDYKEISFDDTADIHKTHPSKWVETKCVITNMYKAIEEGNEQSGLNVYTDASASSYGKGWSFVVYRHGFRIANRKGSITSDTVIKVELYAILQALRFINNEAKVSVTETVEVRTDCKAAVQMLCNYVQYENLQMRINEELMNAKEGNIHVSIRWVPGHKDVLGNEDADKEAKRAVDSKVNEVIKQTQGTVKNAVKQKRKDDMNNAWESQISSSTKKLLSTMNDVHRFMASSPSPALCNIVSGHSRLNDFICRKLKLINSAKCRCGNEDETITHFLLECPLYCEIREKVWPNYIAEYEFITKDWEKLKQYIDETGRFRGRQG